MTGRLRSTTIEISSDPIGTIVYGGLSQIFASDKSNVRHGARQFWLGMADSSHVRKNPDWTSITTALLSALRKSISSFLDGGRGIREAQQFRCFGAKLEQLLIGGLVLFHPLDRLVVPVACF